MILDVKSGCALTGLYPASGSAVSLTGYVVPCVRFNDVVQQADSRYVCPCSQAHKGRWNPFSYAEGFRR